MLDPDNSQSDENESLDSLAAPPSYTNKRVYYAIQAVAADPVDNDNQRLGIKLKLQGLQGVSFNTSLDYEPVSQLGSLALYDQTLTSRTVEMTLSKVIDNKPPLYLMLTQGTAADSSGKNIYDLGSRRCDMYFGIWKDTNSFASGLSIETLKCSGMAISNIEYNFTIDDLTESVTLEGFHKDWDVNNLVAQNPQDGTEVVEPTVSCEGLCTVPGSKYITPDTVVVADRKSIDFQSSILPTGSGGIYGSIDDLRIISMNIKCSIDREKVFSLGQFMPTQNFIINPATIDFSIETLMTPNELEKFHEYQEKKYVATLVENQAEHPVLYDVKFPPDPNNNWWKGGTTLLGPNGNLNFCTTEIPKHTFPKTILLVIKNCNKIESPIPPAQTDTDQISFYLGSENRITSIDYSNSTNGENVIVRYNFRNYNTFSITHDQVVIAGRFSVNSKYQ